MFPLNINISSIKRIKGKDRYGKPLRQVVATDVYGYFKKSTIVTRSVDGSFSEIDGELYTHVEVKQQDQIILENGDIYYVFSVNENNDCVGNIDHWSCQLVKNES